MKPTRHLLFWAILARGLLLTTLLYAQVQITISGQVTDEVGQPIAGAVIILTPQQAGSLLVITTKEDGSFSVSRDLTANGSYYLLVQAEGYYDLKKKEPMEVIVGGNIINAKLIKKTAATFAVEVTDDPYSAKHLEIEQVEMSQPLSAKQIDDIPAPRSAKLENMIAVLPGVTKDAAGDLHFFGSSASQTNWLFNGFNIADPASGKLEATIGVETVGGLNAFSSRYSVEYGAGSGGTMAIETKTPANKTKYNLTNFFPGVQLRKGLTFDSWGPRANISGPIKKNRAWYFAGLHSDYKKSVFNELPEGADQSLQWNASGVTRFQFNPTPRHTLHAGLLYHYFDAPTINLSPLDPFETTSHWRSRRRFFYLKEQFFPNARTLLELGYAHYQSEHWERAKGEAAYQLFNGQKRGNSALNLASVSQRHEWQVNSLLPGWTFWGDHQPKVGFNLQNISYEQTVKRNRIEYYRLNNTKVSETVYGGPGHLTQTVWESAWYGQDRWTVPRQSWLLLESGLRLDYHSLLQKAAITPRFSFALMPPWLKKRTKFSAGFALVPEKSNLRLLTRHLDQYSVTTGFRPDGRTPLGPPSVSVLLFSPQGLSIPKTTNTSFGLEQQLPRQIFLQFNYLYKFTRNGYAFFPLEHAPEIAPPYPIPYPEKSIHWHRLSNNRRDDFHFVEIAASKKFKNKYDWFGSYSWSRTLSNAAADLSVDSPIVYNQTSGRLSWDNPHRLVSWGLFPLHRRHEAFYFLEWKDGFPYFVHNDEGAVVGDFNAFRLPRQFTFNLRYAFHFKLFGQGWRLLAGVENITNHPNALFINQNIDSPNFGALTGLQPRRLVIGLRWLKKEKN